jgi:molecular chaperone GrpE
MVPNPKPHVPGVAPGEPEAPVAAPQAAPAPTGPNHPADARHENGQGGPEGPAGLDRPERPERPERPAGAERPESPVRPDGPERPEGAQGALQAELGQTPEEAPQPDLEEISAKAEKADQYLELAQRTQADFENYRKRAARETAAAQERGVAKLARELLPAVDNLDRALEAVQGDSDNGASTLVSGIKLVHADVIAALSRAGIERFSPQGERFDPQRHEAIAQQPVQGAEPGTVVEVYQRGYVLGESVIRPARVVVAG